MMRTLATTPLSAVGMLGILVCLTSVNARGAVAETERDAYYRTHASVDADNFDDGGALTRAVHLAMPEYFHHAVIHRGGPVTELGDAPRADIAALKIESRLGTTDLEAFAASDRLLDAIIVLHRASIAFERYPQMQPHQKHITWSVAKPIAAAAIVLLEQDGSINLSNDIANYLPALTGSAWQGVSVQQVLDMASGIDCPETADGYSNPDTCYYQFEASLDLLPRTADTASSPFEYLPRLHRHRRPGSAFEYTSVNTMVLQWLVEAVSGQPYASFVSDRIWRRIGAEADAYLGISRSGAPMGHGVISATLRDVARFGLSHTPTGARLNVLLPADYTDRIASKRNRAAFVAGGAARAWTRRLGGEAPTHGAFQWDFVMSDGDFYKNGFGGQGLYVSPGRELVIAWFGTHDKKGNETDMVSVARQIARSGLFPVGNGG